MKSKKLTLLSLLMLGTISLSSCYIDLGFIQIGEKEEGSSTTDIKKYYSSITNQSGTALLTALNKIIKHDKVIVSYDWSRYRYADEAPNDSTSVFLLYARKNMKKSLQDSGGDSAAWNREHTFPQSKMSGDATSDTHIIFASDKKVNSTRSALRFGVVSGGSVVYDSTGAATTCQSNGSLFDPNNEARGVVARSTMYAAAMYGYSPTNNFESLATMLKWNKDYPVTSFDKSRNEKVYSKQKNRNPFVDHPEYACKIWGSSNSQTKSICGL
jgi:hypothetical protein